ncbi:rhodanese-like domain-containing protein [Thiorhodococcus mannitoliphagus]|uniref:Rhodanese-like domain-containing protein n=1 Tax=Thiorhodococcus mannitoliphagus TaxID=329406 RepID=A0A6P1E551_9GAMM|nr:rhodanese-like domain-containing protein [Thiorhodococcus mannitoliphagus]NEX23154.1 rhodanese-like domain-containing protein [Thiorhodococcus mannitoliphagus]
MYDVFTPSKPVGLMDFVTAAKSCIKEVTAEELQQMRAEQGNLMILDVRESSEHEQGHIENALLVPRGILEAAADSTYEKSLPELASSRERPVVAYCATGGRSAMAAAVLQMMGFQHVYSLLGGFVGWEQAQMPVKREARYV